MRSLPGLAGSGLTTPYPRPSSPSPPSSPSSPSSPGIGAPTTRCCEAKRRTWAPRTDPSACRRRWAQFRPSKDEADPADLEATPEAAGPAAAAPGEAGRFVSGVGGEPWLWRPRPVTTDRSGRKITGRPRRWSIAAAGAAAVPSLGSLGKLVREASWTWSWRLRFVREARITVEATAAERPCRSRLHSSMCHLPASSPSREAQNPERVVPERRGTSGGVTRWFSQAIAASFQASRRAQSA
mmetsp:Transcript_42017/g.94922  ORF Transcript_42017/g.94922 Transcript_42017/m.94922 type:complete len:240 (-) Transcript_42017:477-1196(-)